MPYKDKNIRKTLVDTCNWGIIVQEDGDNVPCALKVRKNGLCRHHYEKFYTTIIYKKCSISSCENEYDSFGDGYCKLHGELNDRRKCECGTTVAGIKSIQCSECKIKSKICNKKGCKIRGAHEFFGRYFCIFHNPERKTCIHKTWEVQCKKSWFKGDRPLCHKHGAPYRKQKERVVKKGRCSHMIQLDTPIKCGEIVMNKRTNFCKYHDKSRNCRMCDMKALIGPQQLCATHVEKNDSVWCPTCGSGISRRDYKCSNC